MSDIRKFFASSGPKKPPVSPKKSALDDVRNDTGSPVKSKKAAKPIKVPQNFDVLDLDSEEQEDPVPKAAKASVKKRETAKRNSKKQVMESSDEEYFNESIVTKVEKKNDEKLKKRSKRVVSSDDDVSPPLKKRVVLAATPSPVKKPPPKKRRTYIEDDSDSDDFFVNEPKQKKKGAAQSKDKVVTLSSDSEGFTVKSKKKAAPEVMDIDEDEEEESEPEIKSPKRGRRRKTPPNQKKLDEMLFSKKIPASKQMPKVLPKQAPAKERKSVDPMTFFGAASSSSQKKPATPVKSKPNVVQVEIEEVMSSPTISRRSPRKPLAQIDKTPSPQKKSASSTPEKPKEQVPPKKQAPVIAEKKPKAKSKPSQKETRIVEQGPPREKTVCVKMFAPEPPVTVRAELPWVEKYKPRDMKSLTGQHTEKAPAKKLLLWLQDWPKHNLGANSLIKKPKPSPFQAQHDGTSFKAALVSGPPGIGKTSAAEICCNALGLKFVEMNASDARNKKLLTDKTSELLGSRQIEEYFGGQKPVNNPNEVTHVLIMDEVDGMSGNQDRGGIAEVIQMIKDSKIPVICICNDRMHPKIRSLANHCFDLRFQRPRVEMIKARLMTIMAREKIKVPNDVLNNLIEASNHDIRQSIYSLQLIAAGAKGTIEKKDISVNIFEAARKILSKETDMALKQEMFFSDYSIMPLFVQENYPSVRADNATARSHIQSLRKAASCIAESDLMDKQIRSQGAWSLLPEYGLLSCAMPAMYLDGNMTDQISFPSWLGKNSSANKRQRMMRQLTAHAHLQITGNCRSMVTDYIPLLREKINRPLVENDSEGVKDALEVYKYYNLLREDTEAIDELGVWPGFKDIKERVSTKAKSAMTRTLNKDPRLLPYAVITAPKLGRKKAVAVEEELDEEGHLITKVVGANSDDEGEEEEAEEVPEMKVKTTSKPTAAAKRGGATGRGRGRGKAKS